MTPDKKAQPPAEPLRLPGHFPLHPGDEVTIQGLGRCRFAGAKVDGETVEWLNVHHPYNGGMRSVTPDRVKTVHRKDKLR